MKKTLALVLLFVFCIGFAIAEETISLPEGKYVIGRDIAAGKYTLTCTGTDGEQVKDAYSGLGKAMDALGGSNSYGDLMGALGGLYEEFSELSIEILGDFGDVLASYSLKNGGSMPIQLNEGTALNISDGSCTLTAIQ